MYKFIPQKKMETSHLLISSVDKSYSIQNLQCKDILICILAALTLVKYFQGKFSNKKETKRNCDQGECETYKAFEALPGPITIPLIGIPVDALFNTDVISIALQWAQKYGHCYRLKCFNSDYVILNSPKYCQAILTSNDPGHFKKADLEERLWPEDVHSLVSFSGDEWKTRRKMLNRSFTYKSLRKYNECFNRQSGNLVDVLTKLFSDGKVHHITTVVRNCIFRQSSETLMGVDLSEVGGGDVFVERVQSFMDMTFERVYSPWLMISWVFRLLCGRHYNEALHEIGQLSQKIIRQYKEKISLELKTGSPNTIKECCEITSIDDESYEDDGRSDCVIETMLRNGVDEKGIVHEVAIMLAIAHDTTSLSVEYALFLLALYPEQQKKCQEEVDKIFEDPTKCKDGYLEYAALAELKYLERCLLEAQRVYPMGSLMRKLETPLRLSEELVIPAGVSAAFISHSLHLSPEFFPDPLKFDPDRFLQDEVKNRHPYAFVPFSGGPRICLGMKLALVELKIVLAKILRNFDICTPDKREDLKLAYRGLPKPVKPINFLLKKRI